MTVICPMNVVCPVRYCLAVKRNKLLITLNNITKIKFPMLSAKHTHTHTYTHTHELPTYDSIYMSGKSKTVGMKIEQQFPEFKFMRELTTKGKG